MSTLRGVVLHHAATNVPRVQMMSSTDGPQQSGKQHDCHMVHEFILEKTLFVP